MRAETLLFVHVLFAAVLVGGLVATAVAAEAGLARLTLRAAIVSAIAALATIVVGEAIRAHEDVEGRWLDVASGAAYAGLLIAGAALVLLAWFALDRPQLARWVAGLALLMTVVALATTFVMAAKPA